MTKVPDPWASLRALTMARIGLGRTGDAPPLGPLLDFQMAHARARDAVHTPFESDAMAKSLEDLHPIQVQSQVKDRTIYLRRPDLGRRLDLEDAKQLKPGDWDAVFVSADGLSSTGVADHAVPVLRASYVHLTNWKLAPPVIASQARVALGDEIGRQLGVQLVVMLIGERPGLSAADSLGIYVTWNPGPGRKDSERNCISNIHPPGGMGYEAAAARLAWLMNEARSRKLTGIALKDDGGALLEG